MSYRKKFSKILVLMIVAALAVSTAAFPVDANAASKKYSKIKCKITFTNANSDTVIKKGKKLKLKYKIKNNRGKKVKVRFKSSNKKIAKVSKKGVIKAKKKGTVKITATCYIKGKISKKKTIRIRVGKPVKSIEISGHRYLLKGTSAKLKVTAAPTNATDKSVVWSSSNPKVVKVTKSGKITAKKNGVAVITATTEDGSKKIDSVKIYSHKYKKSDTHWIAHRGLHEDVAENTAAAFRLAGEAGFWGCECDIRETKHVIEEQPPEDPEDPEEPGEENPGEPSDGQDTSDDLNASDDQGSSGEQSPSTEQEPVDEQDPEEGVTEAEEEFDIVINHDEDFSRVFGVDQQVISMTTEEITQNEKLSDVCFFDEYLSICKEYGMVPIIEIKDPEMSDAAIAKTVSMVSDAGLLETAQFTSFYSATLARVQSYITETYGFKPYTGYICKNAANAIERAKKRGFSGVNIPYSELTTAVNKECDSNGFRICTWTYKDNYTSIKMLYKHLISGKYNVFSVTTDVKFFQ